MYLKLHECLEEVIDYRGKTPNKMGGNWEENGEYKVFSAKNLKGMRIVNPSSLRKVNQNVYKKWMKKEVQKEDIFMTSEAPLGETLFWDSEEKIVLGQRLFGLRAKRDIVYPRYLFYYLNSSIYQKELFNKASGSTVFGVRQEQLKKTKVWIPSYEEQVALGDRLYLIDEKIKLNEKMIKNLETYIDLLFYKWFVDFKFPTVDGKEYTLSEGKKETHGGRDLPIGWKISKIGDVTSNFDSKRVPLSEIERRKRKGSYPYYGATKIMDHIDDYLFDGIHCLIAEDGTVIDEQNRPIMQLARGRFWVNNHAHVLKGKDQFSTEYIYLSLKRTNVLHAVTGAIQKKINQRNLNKLSIVHPTDEVLLQFNEIASSVFEKINHLRDEMDILIKYRDTSISSINQLIVYQKN